MDKLKHYSLKHLKKTQANKVEPGQIVAEMEKRFPLTRQYFDHVDDVAQYFALLLPIEEPEMERLSNLTFLGNFMLTFDDQIEKGAQYGTKLIKLLNGEVEASEDVESEVLYVKVIKGVVESMDEYFKQRIIKTLKGMFETMSAEHSMNFNEMTMDQYMSFRAISNGNDYFMLGIDYGLNVIFEPELRDSPLMKELRKDTDFFFNVVQDMYSYRKEVDQGYSDINYVSLKMSKIGIGLDECIDQIIVELDETETRIVSNLNNLLDSKPGITELYFKSYSNLLTFFVYIHKVMKRYNNK